MNTDKNKQSNSTNKKKKKVVIGSIIAAVGISAVGAGVFFLTDSSNKEEPQEEIALEEESEEVDKKTPEDEQEEKEKKETEADFSFLEDDEEEGEDEEEEFEKIPESEQPVTDVDVYLTTDELALREKKFDFESKRDDDKGYKLSNEEYDHLYASRQKPDKQFMVSGTGTIIDMYESGDEDGVRLNLQIYTGDDVERAELNLNDPDRFFQEGRLYDVIADDYMEVDFDIGQKVTFKGYYEPYMFDDAAYKIITVKNATLDE